jgi:hypothetical protein
MLLRAASVVLLATALVSGCSSSGAPSQARGMALSDVVLQDSDLPAGWTDSPHVVKGDEDTQETQLLHCTKARDTRPNVVGSVQSPDFVSDQGRIASVISRYRSQTDVDDDAKALTKKEQELCREKVTHSSLTKQIKSSSAANSTKISKIDVTVDTKPKGLPKDVKAVVHTLIELSTTPRRTAKDPRPKAKITKAYIDIAYIFGRRIEASVTFTNSDEPVDSDLQTRVITKVADRAAKI